MLGVGCAVLALTLALLGGGGGKGPLWFFANSSRSNGKFRFETCHISPGNNSTPCEKLVNFNEKN